MYGPGMVQYGYFLRLYALLYVLTFVDGPFRIGLQVMEFTIPIFWSYQTMTAFAFVFAVPMAKRLELTGSLLGLSGSQILFQGIVGATLIVKSRRMEIPEGLVSQTPSTGE